MTVNGGRVEDDESNLDHLIVDGEDDAQSSGATPSRPAIATKSSFLNVPHAHLSIPIRPLSPDTLSNLSIDEYEQLSPAATRNGYSDASIEASLHFKGRWQHRFHRYWIRDKGIAYMLLGQVFGVLMNVTARLLEVEGNKGKGLHPFQILFARMSITFVLASGYMWYKKTPHFPLGMPEIRWLLIARGLCGFFGVFGMYYSLLYLPLADATVITYLAPGLACWACSIVLKEPFTRVEQIGGLVSILGVALIARPTVLFSALGGDGSTAAVGDGLPSNSTVSSESDASSYEDVTPSQRLTAVGVALVGVLGAALAYTVLRWIGKRAHPLITVNYFAGWCFLVSIVALSVLPDIGWSLPADFKEWGLLIFLGICGFVMQFLLATALAYEKSSRATNMIYTSMLFALLFDKLIFDHTPGITSILGSSLILGSAITVAMQNSTSRTQQKEIMEDQEGDEELRAGLMSGARDVVTAEDHDRLPVQEVQLRTLR